MGEEQSMKTHFTRDPNQKKKAQHGAIYAEVVTLRNEWQKGEWDEVV